MALAHVIDGCLCEREEIAPYLEKCEDNTKKNYKAVNERMCITPETPQNSKKTFIIAITMLLTNVTKDDHVKQNFKYIRLWLDVLKQWSLSTLPSNA